MRRKFHTIHTVYMYIFMFSVKCLSSTEAPVFPLHYTPYQYGHTNLATCRYSTVFSPSTVTKDLAVLTAAPRDEAARYPCPPQACRLTSINSTVISAARAFSPADWQ